MSLRLYNTASRQKEEFTPTPPHEVRMYHCGPTVYDRVHIGNLRPAVLADILRRTLEKLGYTTKQVMNITDIGHLVGDSDDGEDKMTAGLKREGLPLTREAMLELGTRYTETFTQDLEAMNILPPHELPRASEHITDDIVLLEKLEDKGFAYRISDGLYFDTSKDPHYGKLAGRELPPIDESRSRIGANAEKRNPRDFALWKLDEHLGWPSPWGKGFPGWHIECSAMSMRYLGESFDIHTGGIDHIPVHHTNEIAQSENATGKSLARFWMHNAFINIEDQKISKSLGNTFSLRDIEEKGFSPLDYRFWLLSVHYRSPMNFSWGALEGAHSARAQLVKAASQVTLGERSAGSGETAAYEQKFSEALQDDLNTPQALAAAFELAKDENLDEEAKQDALARMDTVLALGLNQVIPDDIFALAKEREAARESKDFATSDRLREELKQKGFGVEDSASSVRLYPLD
ncbi:MAG TPA: cysteine--tRNA ligase [Candidatus Paceibacterota bacterium]|nr:cysteine--tRNA ligase [Candidatus Paceibacterota bacterium]